MEVESCMVVVKKTNNIINFQDALNVFTPIFFSSTHPVIRDPTSAQKITIITSKTIPRFKWNLSPLINSIHMALASNISEVQRMSELIQIFDIAKNICYSWNDFWRLMFPPDYFSCFLRFSFKYSVIDMANWPKY